MPSKARGKKVGKLSQLEVTNAAAWPAFDSVVNPYPPQDVFNYWTTQKDSYSKLIKACSYVIGNKYDTVAKLFKAINDQISNADAGLKIDPGSYKPGQGGHGAASLNQDKIYMDYPGTSKPLYVLPSVFIYIK